MNTKRKGIRFENYVKKYWIDKGMLCFRQAASSFPDLIAFAKDHIYFIECKTTRADKKTIARLKQLLKKIKLPIPVYGVLFTPKEMLIISKKGRPLIFKMKFMTEKELLKAILRR